MRQSVCIVPFTKNEWPLLQNLPSSYSIGALVAPRGIGTAGEDVAVLKNKGNTGYCFTNSIKYGINSSDIVLISRIQEEQTSLYKFALQALEEAVAEGKDIICFAEIDPETRKKYEEAAAPKATRCLFIENDTLTYQPPSTGDKFHKIHVPVIYIGETIHGCEGYDVFIKLAHSLNLAGKRVLAISEDCYNELFGFGFHHVQFWPNLDPVRSVYAINEYVYQLALTEHPDVILIKLPEPMMKYDDDNPFDFGMTAFMMSQAVPGDGCICCTYSGNPTSEFWDNINENFKAKFGYPIIAVHLCNQVVDSTQEVGVSTIFIPPDAINVELLAMNASNNVQFYDFNCDDDMKRFCELLQDEFFDVPYGVIEL